jgi:hypothetical protein
MQSIWLVAAVIPLAVGVIGLVLVGWPNLSNDDTKVAAWGVIVNFLAALGAIIAGVAAYSSYATTQNAERIRRAHVEIERFYAPKISVLEKAKKVASQLVEESDFNSEAATAGIRQFWTLYYGDLIGVESNKVAGAMVEFGRALKDAKIDKPDSKRLGKLSLKLSDAVVEQVSELVQDRDKKKKEAEK